MRMDAGAARVARAQIAANSGYDGHGTIVGYELRALLDMKFDESADVLPAQIGGAARQFGVEAGVINGLGERAAASGMNARIRSGCLHRSGGAAPPELPPIPAPEPAGPSSARVPHAVGFLRRTVPTGLIAASDETAAMTPAAPS